MLHITDEQVKKYQAIYYSEYHEPVDNAKARTELTALVCLLDIVHREMEQHGWPDVSNI
jgi:hypothetical protein